MRVEAEMRAVSSAARTELIGTVRAPDPEQAVCRARPMCTRADHPEAGEMLERIADALGCPVAIFRAGAPTGAGAREDAAAGEIAELLRLWPLIGSPDARRQLLADIRRLAYQTSGIAVRSS